MIIRYEYYLLAKLLGKSLLLPVQGISAFVSVFILYFSKMGAKDNFSAVCDQFLDGRKCCNETVFICDLAIFQRYVEITSVQGLFFPLH